jgi:hypothetical protein
MVLHLPHDEGGFGVPFNCVTKDDAFYTTTSRFVSWMGDLTSILSCLLSTTVRRSVCRFNHRVMSDLVLDEALRMVSLSSRRLLLSPFRS